MGAFLNSVFGQMPGLSQAVQLPAFPSLALAGAPSAGLSGASVVSSTAPSASASPAPPSPTLASGGSPSGVAPAPGQSNGQAGPTPAQVSAYRNAVQGELTGVYSRVASVLGQSLGSNDPYPVSALGGELALEGSGVPRPAGVPALTPQEAALLGPNIANAWPWGAGSGGVVRFQLGEQALNQVQDAAPQGHAEWPTTPDQTFLMKQMAATTSPWQMPSDTAPATDYANYSMPHGGGFATETPGAPGSAGSGGPVPAWVSGSLTGG